MLFFTTGSILYHIFTCYVQPKMNFTQNISAYTIGLLADKNLPDIAMTGLEEGYDSDTLRILAGHNSSDNAFQLVDYFNDVLKELDLTLPDRKSALIEVIKFHANKISSKLVDPYLGFQVIVDIINRTEFYYDNINLMDCYADYISIWEVKSDGLQLHEGLGLTKEQYIEKIKEDLVYHISKWLTEIGST